MKPLHRCNSCHSWILLSVLVAPGVSPAAQAPGKPAATPAGAAASAPANPAEAPPAPPPNFSYTVDGRRDPFLSLVNRGTTGRNAQPGTVRAEGLGGISVEEVAIRGIFQTRGQWVAMIAAPSGRTYSIRAGDRLLDGTVKAIAPREVVLMQDVTDPLSLQKQREVRKSLRGEVK
jgi:Tfp pilus assembly protein PilP